LKAHPGDRIDVMPGVYLERVQRRVVPGAFVERPRSGRFSGRSAIGDVGAFLSDQRLEGGERRPETVVDLITRCCMPPESAESTA
jgi:hypothetical protein